MEDTTKPLYDREAFGKAIEEKRMQMNVSQEWLANALGIGRNRLSTAETGTSWMSLRNYAVLCLWLEVPLEKYLFRLNYYIGRGSALRYVGK